MSKVLVNCIDATLPINIFFNLNVFDMNKYSRNACIKQQTYYHRHKYRTIIMMTGQQDKSSKKLFSFKNNSFVFLSKHNNPLNHPRRPDHAE